MKLFFNALGLVTPLGHGKRAVAENLFRGTRDGLVERRDLIPDRAAWVGMVPEPLPDLPPHLARFDCRNNRLALAALAQIEPEIAVARGHYGADRVAVIMGTSTAGIAEGEAALAQRLATGQWPAAFHYARQEMSNLAAFVAAACDLTGPAYTITTACSSSGKAFASAVRLIAMDACDAAIVGGVDTLCRLTLNGFHALEAIAATPCNPFSANRNGINIGEGAAIMLVSRQPGPVALLGVGESSDAHHMSAPDPNGGGAAAAMRDALTSAALTSDAIGYVNLHGTATVLNDLMESRAVHAVLGGDVPCSSTKAMTGHMLGAAGACEAAFLWLALQPEFSAGRLPPHLWDGVIDAELSPLHFIGPGTVTRPGMAMMSNSFAFGGNNVSLILGATA